MFFFINCFYTYPKTFFSLYFTPFFSKVFIVGLKKSTLKINGQNIPGSNIIDLVRSMMHKTAKTSRYSGQDEFEKVLSNLNVPVSLIGNPVWRYRLNFLKGKPLESRDTFSHPLVRVTEDKMNMIKRRKQRKTINKKPFKWIHL